MTPDALLERIRRDYASFPDDQGYDLYAEDVEFRDPLNRFRGRDRYRANIGFIARWFRDIDLQLHDLGREGDRLHTRWTLSFTSPLPWRPRTVIPGRTEMTLNAEGRIARHIDTWDISPWAVLWQQFSGQRAAPGSRP
jgi:Uncharacterized conserved protein (DUF2358)